MLGNVTNKRIAWSLADIAELTGLSISFLRKEAKRGILPVKRCGRRVLVLKGDLEKYLLNGSQKDIQKENEAELKSA